jgi:stearoyl-CoA desaturase (delta-9 desaturase)
VPGRPPLRTRKAAAHLFGLLAPPAGVVVAVIMLWNRAVGWTDLLLLAGMYLAVAPGITVGYHRLLTHRAFATYPAVRYAFAGLGSMAMQGSVIDWVADHRLHHAHADGPGDPHSPHGDESLLRSLWHAHAGWLFRHQGRADHTRHAPELLEDRGMRIVDRAFPAFVLLSLAIPAAAGWALSGSAAGAVTGLVWGGLVRVFVFHHVIFSVNSIGHYFGRRRFATDDRSTNLILLALPSLGESWHHNHHAFPRSALLGMRWFELDLSGLLIRVLDRLGLAGNVVVISPERQRQRLAA